MKYIEPEIGEYIRTKDGDIFRLTQYRNFNGSKIMQDNLYAIYGRPDKVVKKCSKKLIGLVEIGDYINGKCVQRIDKDNKLICGLVNGIEICYWEEDIKSFVTKEQFKNQEEQNKKLLK